jgi:hypothetical protein
MPVAGWLAAIVCGKAVITNANGGDDGATQEPPVSMPRQVFIVTPRRLQKRSRQASRMSAAEPAIATMRPSGWRDLSDQQSKTKRSSS